jgi:formamidopyrimidine-DNA glycosylase
VLESVRITHPFLLRTFEPPLTMLTGRKVESLRRVGKRIALGFEGDLWLVMHLMIAGRLHWFAAGKKPRAALASFTFDSGTLTLTEAGSKRRASLHVFGSSQELARHDPHGLEVLESSFEEFRARLVAENHTLKRALTDPRAFSGIGNAYSDEILHHAGLSPVALTQRLDMESIRKLYDSIRTVLPEWTRRLRDDARGEFPEKGHGVPAGHGGARAVRPALPGVWHAGAAHPVCRERDQLLRALPDRRQAARGPRVVAAAQE